VAIVGASLSESVAAICRPAKPISVLIIQGTDDSLVPLAGGALGRRGGGGVVLSHAAALQKFVEANHCAPEPKEENIPDTAKDGTSIDVVTYVGCAGGSEVQGYIVKGGGHTWPGGMQYLPAALIGKTTQDLDGSEVIGEFLSHHVHQKEA
jgi:polyhydroxybutyrate depolymerase